MRSFAIVLFVGFFLGEARGCTWRDSPIGCASGPCGVGTFYDDSDKECLACPSGHYMSADGHNCTSCKPCTEAIAENMEVVEKACDASHDTKIKCEENYFMAGKMNGLHPEFSCWRCSKCKENEILSHKCTAYQNTVCTLKDNREAPKTVVASGVTTLDSLGTTVSRSRLAKHVYDPGIPQQTLPESK